MDVYMCIYIYTYMYIGAVAKSVECKPHVQEIASSIPSRVKPMTYKIDTFCFLAQHSALIG